MSSSAVRLYSNAPLRRVLNFAPLGIAAVATALAFAPQFFAPPLALTLGVGLLFLYPGYLLEQFLFAAREISLTRLPIFFAFSLAIWALPATTLQLLGAHWFAFRLTFVGALWALTLLVLWTRRRRPPVPAVARTEWLVEGALLLLCALAAFLVARGPRDGDDWMYLQVIQQMMASDPFQIRAASEMRYSIRFAAHVWLFAQAFLGQWLNADVVWLARELLPTLLAPLALVSFFAWGKIFFQNARAALLAVVIQFLIYVTFARGDAWGLGFIERAAQDKFLVWLVLLPVALGFAWRYLHRAKLADWFAYGVTLLGALWVHPVSLFAIVLTLGGLALFNLISRAPFPRRRWGMVLLLTLPVACVPLLVRVATAPAVFQVSTPDVASYLRLSQGRLLFQPPNYIADPALLGHPAILFALALLIWFAPRVRTDARIQFLWGSALLPLALLFNPFTARLLGEALTPWQLWRMTWNLPVAFILTEGVRTVVARRTRTPDWKTAARALTLLVVLGGAIWLADLNLARSWKNLNSAHALDASAADMLNHLRADLREPALTLLPRDMTRYAPAYTYNALVLTDNAHLREGVGGAEIDRFYNSTDAQLWEAFLREWKIAYVVVPNDSPQQIFLSGRAKARQTYRNAGLTLYQLAP